MQILDTHLYVGPNQYAFFPVIRLTLDIGELEDWPTGRLGAGFRDALLAALPGLRLHRCSWGVEGGFVRRMTEDEGTWLPHVLEHTAIEIQCAAGSAVSFGRARGTGVTGQYHVIYQYADSDLGLRAGQLALRLILSLLPPALLTAGRRPDHLDFQAELEGLARSCADRAPGPSTAALLRAADRRRIPWFRLDDDFMLQLGTGVHQRRVEAAITSETSALAVEVASNKALTNRLLDELGIPVPAHFVVRSEDEAVDAADRLGYPVVLKPVDGNHGRGVTPNVEDAAEVRTAFHRAQEHCQTVLVEEHIDGRDYRLLVVGDAVVAAARRVPGHVTGDGASTVAQLVERVNADPRRGEGHTRPLTRLQLDEHADRMLARRGMNRTSVPRADETVPLRATANLSTGGTAIDVTDRVHEDNLALAVRAARAVGLDVAGVDFLTPDIALSYSEVGGAICEVNAAPGLRMHLAPAVGRVRDVAGPIMDRLFPPGTRSTVPLAAITGTNGKTTTAMLVAHILGQEGLRVGLTTTDGVYIGGRCIARGDMTGPTSARMVLRDPTVEAAVLETARGGLLRAGLAFRHCDVGAVLNVGGDHLGQGGIESNEELAELKRIVIEVATATAVLNADDPLCVAMAGHTTARVCYFSMDAENELIDRHVAAGGRAVVFVNDEDQGTVVMRYRNNSTHVARAHDLPFTLRGRARFNVANALAATAIAFAMGCDVFAIRRGLQTFGAHDAGAAGRLTELTGLPFRLFMDYGHNPPAVRAVSATVERIGCDGRRICVLSAPGDRRDDDIREIARGVSGHFDLYICRRDDSLRGRRPDEVPLLLRDALVDAGVDSSTVEMIPDEAEAVETALRIAQPGDLLLLFYDAFGRTRNQIEAFRSNSAGMAIAGWKPAAPLPVGLPGTVAGRGPRRIGEPV